jgi:N-acetylglucosaminyldiphosphoundecaprenol N-acetyl-beta-D-mannosaminyltransferase
MPGVEVVHYLLEWEGVERLRVAFIGGRGNLAEELADCYQAKWPQAQFVGMIGIKDIQNPGENEEKKLFSIVAELKPHLVLVAFGSPAQELWIEANKGRFGPAVVMGVGGAFDFLGGRVARAPKWMRATGLEWLFRLARQPWRLRRQMRLIEFMWLVILQRVGARKSE